MHDAFIKIPPYLVPQIPGPVSDSSVLRNAKFEHGDTANKPPVLINAESKHGSTLFPDTKEAPASRALPPAY